jgi:hypothetical protein
LLETVSQPSAFVPTALVALRRDKAPSPLLRG